MLSLACLSRSGPEPWLSGACLSPYFPQQDGTSFPRTDAMHASLVRMSFLLCGTSMRPSEGSVGGRRTSEVLCRRRDASRKRQSLLQTTGQASCLGPHIRYCSTILLCDKISIFVIVRPSDVAVERESTGRGSKQKGALQALMRLRAAALRPSSVRGIARAIMTISKRCAHIA